MEKKEYKDREMFSLSGCEDFCLYGQVNETFCPSLSPSVWCFFPLAGELALMSFR